MMKTIITLTFLIFTILVKAQSYTGNVHGFTPSRSFSVVQDKNFYLLTAIQHTDEVQQLLEHNKTFKTIFEAKKAAIAASLQNKQDTQNMVNAYAFSSKEIDTITAVLKAYVANATFTHFIANNLRASHNYIAFEKQDDANYIASVWQLCAHAMNRVLHVYGLGEAPAYAKMDSISYDKNSDFFKGALYLWSDFLANQKPAQNTLFFQPSLDYVNALLYLNHRDEAGLYEPMDSLENKKAVAYIQNVNFDDYPYASIVVLGNGPENYTDRLSAVGKLNLRIGVLQYQEGKAPFIIVSGGHAHPFRTQYCEAIEMKKELMQKYHISEEHIIIEPHARHTTTNLRNAVRLMVKYRMPLTKKSVVVTNNFHSHYLTSKSFSDRCFTELGYLPVTLLPRLTPTVVAFTPNFTSLQQQPNDPLDP
ncbi:YdcF family protein [Zhouia sp. PK063]|uniref:YdcF family protein n=1 Tax=Zhouia sp. PK063 TaxID=3373602 RepID=UPI00378921FE